MSDNNLETGTNYYPTNHSQVGNLIGKTLTQIEALGLSQGQEKAVKDVFQNMIWDWFQSVCTNSITAYAKELRPITVADTVKEYKASK